MLQRGRRPIADVFTGELLSAHGSFIVPLGPRHLLPRGSPAPPNERRQVGAGPDVGPPASWPAGCSLRGWWSDAVQGVGPMSSTRGRQGKNTPWNWHSVQNPRLRGLCHPRDPPLSERRGLCAHGLGPKGPFWPQTPPVAPRPLPGKAAALQFKSPPGDQHGEPGGRAPAEGLGCQFLRHRSCWSAAAWPVLSSEPALRGSKCTCRSRSRSPWAPPAPTSQPLFPGVSGARGMALHFQSLRSCWAWLCTVHPRPCPGCWRLLCQGRTASSSSSCSVSSEHGAALDFPCA